MLIYSKQIVKFIKALKILAKEVLSQEIGLKVSKNRFYDRRQEYSYPIDIVVFNNQQMLGYFDPHFYELGFHECLLHSDQEQLKNIIRHELTHYMTFINYGETAASHGAEFQSFCRRMGWGEDVWKATTCLDDRILLPQAKESSVLRKVKKLMALASSANKNEAEQAMLKSQQMLLMHNIDIESIKDEDDETFILKRTFKQKKKNAKMQSIAKILETFFVNTVFHRQGDFVYLEVVGSAVNVEIAEYVAETLQCKLDSLWAHNGLTGTIAKNSFFLGVAKGYCDKIHFLKRQYSNSTSNALMVIEKKLEEAKALTYPRLSKSRSHARFCTESSRLGEQAGRQLNINPAINRSPNHSRYLS